ncbi:MAG: hypothetical protein JW797_09785 [Bradymonadales bacterium]|nr:hypothetical protein [Bradymonadales bacterium]
MSRFRVAVAIICSAASFLWALQARGEWSRTREIADIQAAIEEAGLRWTAGETPQNALPPTERPAGAYPSTSLVEIWSEQPPTEEQVPLALGALLPSVDWRDRWGFNWVTPIRDQGDCGACWAFATIADVELMMALRHSVPDPQFDLSEQHLLDCATASLSCDSGGITWGPPGWWLRDTGVTTEECYPYVSGETGSKGVCLSVSSMTTECQEAIVQVEGISEITTTMPAYPWWDPPDYFLSDADMETIKNYLAQRPVGVSMRIYSDLWSYTGGIYEPALSSSTPPSREGVHAVLLVGYHDADDEEAVGYWIVKNSWGDQWGEEGFFRIRYNTSSIGMWAYTYDYLEDHAEPAFCDDLPEQLSIDVSLPDDSQSFELRNCGGGVLIWQAQIDNDWIRLEDDDGQVVDSGVEVSLGSSYHVRTAYPVASGLSSSIALTGASNGPVVIQVITIGAVDPGAEQVDAGPDLSLDPTLDAADLAPDVSTDLAVDTAPDLADLPADLRPDPSLDAAPDGSIDISLDSAADTTPDVAMDTPVDSTADTPSDGQTDPDAPGDGDRLDLTPYETGEPVEDSQQEVAEDQPEQPDVLADPALLDDGETASNDLPEQGDPYRLDGPPGTDVGQDEASSVRPADQIGMAAPETACGCGTSPFRGQLWFLPWIVMLLAIFYIRKRGLPQPVVTSTMAAGPDEADH